MRTSISFSFVRFPAVAGDRALIISFQTPGLLIYLHVGLVLILVEISGSDNSAARRQLIVKYRLVIVGLGEEAAI